MAFVTIAEVEELVGPITDPLKRAKVELDLAAVQETLEGWLRRKLEPQTIVDEEHISTSNGVFLHWGDPMGEAMVKLDTPYADSHYLRGRWPEAGRRIYVSYTPDTTVIQNYTNTIKRIILSAVIPGLMKSDAVRYKVISNYSVEGLSVTYNNGQGEGNIGELAMVDLAALIPLRRSVVL